MPVHELFEPWVELPDIKVITGTFPVNGASNPASVSSGYFTAVRSAAGTFDVTLTERVLLENVGFHATLSCPAVGAGALNRAVTGPVNLATGVFQIFTVNTTTGAAVDVAANASSVISFTIFARKSD